MNYAVQDYRVGYANGTAAVGVDEWALLGEERYLQNGLWEWDDSEVVQQCEENGNWPRCGDVLDGFPPRLARRTGHARHP